MGDLFKINACVYSRKGYEREDNRDDFYMNGKFLSEQHLDNMQASMENRGREYFFATADHMEFSDDEQRASFSILREVAKFHEKITVHEGDLSFKTKEITSRVLETGKYLESFLDMNHVAETDPERQMGFSGLLLSDGQAVGVNYGTGQIYLCRGNVFRHMTADRAKPQRLAELGIISDEEAEEIQEKYETEKEEQTNPVTVSEPIEVLEGDKFLLISDGVYHALGEEYLQDILSMRSDSTYIAYRLISEALKRDSSDDMTAMVVRVEKVTTGAGIVKKPAEKPKAATRTSTLKNTPLGTPSPTYKYRKSKGIKKYENIIYNVAVVLTSILFLAIALLIIKNMFNKVRDPDNTPTTTTTQAASPTPTTEETPEPTPGGETSEPTTEPVETQPETREHTVERGDTLSSIARKYYGDDYSLVEKLGLYNEIPAPYDNIILGQKIIIPPKEELLKIR